MIPDLQSVRRAEAGREVVRVDEARSAAASEAARTEARGLAVSLRGSGTQSAAAEQADPVSGDSLSGEKCLCGAENGSAEMKRTLASKPRDATNIANGERNQNSDFFSKLFSRAITLPKNFEGGFSP